MESFPSSGRLCKQWWKSWANRYIRNVYLSGKEGLQKHSNMPRFSQGIYMKRAWKYLLKMSMVINLAVPSKRFTLQLLPTYLIWTRVVATIAKDQGVQALHMAHSEETRNRFYDLNKQKNHEKHSLSIISYIERYYLAYLMDRNKWNVIEHHYRISWEQSSSIARSVRLSGGISFWKDSHRRKVIKYTNHL